jgi:ABC-2 type transport system permease protein
MRMYKESLRKLLPVGLPLAILTLLYTGITGGQNCFGEYTITQANTAIGVAPILVYYVYTAALFALYGFSFLFRRSSSDLYHSFPVKRTDMYLSVTLATATWMGTTIVANLLTMLMMFLVSGCPFVPAYIALDILFYFTAAMLVYAATAIGCALSGTYVTAAAATGIVLLLPRFVQFIIARGLVVQVPIIGWLDMNALLNPMSNIATGMLVMQVRNMLIPEIVQLPNILYSFALMAVEMLLAWRLFVRRPSETADRGASSKAWSIAMACLLALVPLLLITVGSHKLLSVYGISISVLALIVYLIYAFVSLRSVKQVLYALPYCLLAGALAFAVSLGIDKTADNALNVTPTADEIVSVSFNGHDTIRYYNEYASILIRDIRFTSEDLRKYVATSLSEAVDRIRNSEDQIYSDTYTYNEYQTIEPITLRLTDGRTIRRTIEFTNIDTLNALRAENDVFQTAIHSFPPESSVQSLNVYADFTKEETRAIWDTYRSEMLENNSIFNDYYLSHTVALNNDGYSVIRGGEQTLNTITFSGYIGTQRYNDYATIRMEAPKTVALLMSITNKYAKKDSVDRFKDAVKRSLSGLALENDSVSMSLEFYNVDMDDGEPFMTSINLYLSNYSDENDSYGPLYQDYAQRLADILQRAQPTDSPEGMFASFNWSMYDSTTYKNTDEPSTYLRFSAEDEATLVTMIDDWQRNMYYGY